MNVTVSCTIVYEHDYAVYHECVYRSRDWSGDFTTSFQDLLPGGVFHISSDKDTSHKVYLYYAVTIDTVWPEIFEGANFHSFRG